MEKKEIFIIQFDNYNRTKNRNKETPLTTSNFSSHNCGSVSYLHKALTVRNNINLIHDLCLRTDVEIGMKLHVYFCNKIMLGAKATLN